MDLANVLPGRSDAKLDSPSSAAVLACLVAVVCYQADRLVYVLGIPPDHIASFWPATAFLVVVLLLAPRSIWSVLIAAGLGAMALADLRNSVPIGFEVWITLGNLAEVLVATLGIRWLFKGAPQLSSLKTLAKYLVLAVILVPLGSAFVGANASGPGGYWLQWRIWFFADSFAFLTVTPAILTWAREGREWAQQSRNYLEFAALMTLLTVFGYLTFMAAQGERPALLYSLVPLLLWAALRFGLKGISTSMLLIALLSTWGAAHGRGPFAGLGPLNNALSLQLFLFFAAIPFTVLAVLVGEQKQDREVLQESEERFRRAAQAGKMFAYEWDVATDVITRSGECAYILGMDETTPMTGQQVISKIHPDDRERLLAVIAKLNAAEPYFQISYRILRSDGTVIWVERKSRAYFDEQGKMLRVGGMVVDITERKRAEETLRRRDAELAESQRLARLGSWQWDPTTDTVTWSEELYRLAGRDPNLPVLSYKDHPKLYTAESWERLRHAVEETLRTGTPYELDLEMVRPDGTTLWLVARGEAQQDATGRIVQLRGTAQDITDRKKGEEALATVSGRLIEAQEKERRRIARELHDDINQRLALLAVELESLRDIRPDSLSQLHDRTDQLIKHTSEISSDVQALSHELHSSKLEYLGIVVAMKSFCNEFAEQQKVEIDFVADDVPGSVPQDVSLCLFRVLQEGLHNAVKHSGVRHFEAQLRGVYGELQLAIRDSGVGFDPGAAESNRGLGIVSMRERAGLVNGMVSIVSKPTGGTEIRVRVPMAVGTNTNQMSTSA